MAGRPEGGIKERDVSLAPSNPAHDLADRAYEK
jgi:hypothetical protein